MSANFTVFDSALGDRVLNAAAISAILAADPGSLAVAAIASALAAGGSPAKFAGITNTGDSTSTPVSVAAAGATQGNATAVPAGALDIVATATASTEGIRLRAAVTGRMKRVWASPTVGLKVYPATGQILGAAATNAAKLVAKNTMVQFYAVDATHWRISG
jgi:hypothetical protein